MDNASFAYETKKPRVNTADVDPVVVELVNTKWELALLKSQLQEAESCIQKLAKGETDSNDKEAVESDPSSASNLMCLKRINFECSEGEFIAVVGGNLSSSRRYSMPPHFF